MAAAEAAIANPLLDETSMKGAKGLLISITGGRDLTLFEVDEAATRIREEVDQDANIILGATFDEELEGVIRVSVVATGIDKTAAEIAAPPITIRQPVKPALPSRPRSRRPPQPAKVQVREAPKVGRGPGGRSDSRGRACRRHAGRRRRRRRRSSARRAGCSSRPRAGEGRSRSPRPSRSGLQPRRRRPRSRACRGSRTSRRWLAPSSKARAAATRTRSDGSAQAADQRTRPPRGRAGRASPGGAAPRARLRQQAADTRQLGSQDPQLYAPRRGSARRPRANRAAAAAGPGRGSARDSGLPPAAGELNRRIDAISAGTDACDVRPGLENWQKNKGLRKPLPSLVP